MSEKKKGKGKAKGKTDDAVDVDSVVDDGEGDPVEDHASEAEMVALPAKITTTSDLMIHLGMSKPKLVKAVDDLVSARKSGTDLGTLLDAAADDITRAKSAENLSAMDLARSEVVGEVALERSLADGEFLNALAVLHGKKKLQADHLKLIAGRKKLEVDDLNLHRQQIILATLNDATEELVSILKEVGLDDDKQQEIITKFGERSGAMFGGSGS